MAAERRASRVEARRRRGRAKDDDVLGKTGVQRPRQSLRGDPRRQVDVRDLARGVDAGVGAAGGGDDGAGAEDGADRPGDLGLDGPAATLRLPAEELRPVVLEEEGEADRGSADGTSAARIQKAIARPVWTAFSSMRRPST